ncbi:tetratricopeptide repeat protein [bacterium]|nr:tetratricopeptide repeat protein [bacterium]
MRNHIIFALLIAVLCLSGITSAAELAPGSQAVMIESTPLYATAEVSTQPDRILKQFSPGEAADVQRQLGKWTQVRFRRKLGWVETDKIVPLDDDAIEVFSKRIDGQPDIANNYIDRAKLWQYLGKPAQALADLNVAIQQDPQSAKAWGMRGYLRFLENKSSKARGDFDRAIELDPKEPLALAYRGLLFREEGKLDEALADQTAAIESDVEEPIFYYIRGLTWLQKKAFDKAVADFTAALERDPKFALAWKHRARAYQQLGKSDLAAKDLSSALKTEIIFVQPLDARQRPATDGKSLPTLEEQLTRAIQFDSEDSTLYHNRGYVRVLLGKLHAAIEDFDAALKLRKDSVSYFLRGWTKRNQGRLDEAIADYDLAVQHDPNFGPAYRDRGYIHDLRNEVDQAMADYNLALHADIRDHVTFFLRGKLWESKGEPRNAISDYSQAIHLKSDYLEAYRRRARLNVEVKEFEDAHSDLEKIKKLEARR